jgi:hypothetical protein
MGVNKRLAHIGVRVPRVVSGGPGVCRARARPKVLPKDFGKVFLWCFDTAQESDKFRLANQTLACCVCGGGFGGCEGSSSCVLTVCRTATGLLGEWLPPWP